MLLANYGSDSGSESEPDAPPAPPPAPKPTTAAQPHKKKKPVKITLDLPKSADAAEDEVDGEKRKKGDADSDDERAPKKARLPKGGKGNSSLLGMLPAPKRKLPAPPSASGSGSKGASGLVVNKAMARSQLPAPPKLAKAEDDSDEEESVLLPPSLARKQNKEEVVDLFGLSPALKPKAATASAIKPPAISSAPLAPDFVPPEPTSSDAYPGYYQLPSGEWRAHDPAYYASFFPSSSAQQEPEEGEDGRVGKHWDAFEKGQFKGQILDIDANQGLEEARKEAERRELMKKPKAPGDEFVYQASRRVVQRCKLTVSQPKGQIKGLASQRHQLTSLLSTAYSQREELEQRIAANKKGMQGAGHKYGF
ncbi:hypothetical protein L198_06365 [Cryptococcus wingfieldii CBS 7118]|uniref:Mitotic checkpoint regulator, MAD2B-interacting-domain-containing protein n=1 Tax=Cryptococcus wingfieldii CBS 7118 TaxID=1295528 RepID=A0A1E3IMN2_9TREE|nr:hypothetical protein L198_06365 [Cryptococcus wingfieldii CBS 7118]ODN89675.1 hypothetical protein L198_06365 [Cryptococcus wingfieldii CBS 7118]